MPRRSALTIPGIYAITNTVSGTVYIGQARNIRRRWESHRHYLAGGTHGNEYLQRAWLKYGAENFTFSVLHNLSDIAPEELRAALNLAEIQTIQTYVDRYNLADGGIVAPLASAKTRAIWSAQRKAMWADVTFRQKRSAGTKAQYADAEWKERHDTATREGQRTPEARANASARFTLMWASPEHRIEQAARCKANWADPVYRAQQTAARKASWANPESRERRMAGIKASVADPDVRKRRADAIRNSPKTGAKERWADPEERAKQSMRRKAAWDRKRAAEAGGL